LWRWCGPWLKQLRVVALHIVEQLLATMVDAALGSFCTADRYKYKTCHLQDCARVVQNLVQKAKAAL
jgi:hypothetical protein